MRLRHRILFALLALLPALAQAQDTSDLDKRIAAKAQATLGQIGAPSVSVAVVRDGKLVFARAFGSASIDPYRPADTNTRYAVGSVSKEFTAAALLLMQERGKLSLDDKVSKYLPRVDSRR